MADIDLAGLLEGRIGLLRSELEQTQQKIYGITLGEVTDTDDPKSLGRVKVRFPWLSSEVDSGWARIAVPWAGQRRGSYLLPEVGDEVVVGFQQGNLKQPCVLGFLWNEKAEPPESSPALERRELRSKSGHLLQFDDTTAAQKVTVQSQSGHKVVLDDTEGGAKISITDSTGRFSVVIDVDGAKISISCSTGNIELSAPAGKVSVQASDLELNATGSLSVQSGGTVSIQGSLVKIN